jgi:hypothetical protein
LGTYFKTNPGAAKGEKPLTQGSFNVGSSTAFIGVQAGSIALGFLVVHIFLLGFFLLISWDYFWEYIYKYLLVDLIEIASVLLFQHFVIEEYLANHLLSDHGTWIKRPVLWTWVMSLSTIASIISGFFVAIRRFITQIGLAVVGIFTLDRSIFPKELAMFDDGYLSYMSAATLANRHRAPAITFWTDEAAYDATTNYERIGIVARRGDRELKSGKFLRARNRWQLALTLVNNPSIIPLRRRGINIRDLKSQQQKTRANQNVNF